MKQKKIIFLNGEKIEKANKVKKFKQKQWLKPYNGSNIEVRCETEKKVGEKSLKSWTLAVLQILFKLWGKEKGW